MEGSNSRTIVFYDDEDGGHHVRVDAPGERAVSAPIDDPIAFLVEAASDLGLEVDDSANTDGRGPITISVVDA